MSKTTGPYSKKVLKYFQHPKNQGRMKSPDGVGKVGNPVCGDVMWVYIEIGENKKKEKIIKDIKFETFGCVAAIATSSVLTDLVKGKTIEDAKKVDNNKIVKSLGGLPPVKVHCSLLAARALDLAIKDYENKNKTNNEKTKRNKKNR